jgi:dihydroorotase-like cyclic amidohydrolase
MNRILIKNAKIVNEGVFEGDVLIENDLIEIADRVLVQNPLNA